MNKIRFILYIFELFIILGYKSFGLQLQCKEVVQKSVSVKQIFFKIYIKSIFKLIRSQK